MICTRTPLRISIIGGGTDMPEFFNLYRGVVVSFTINKYIYVFYNKKFDERVRISYSKTEMTKTVSELENEIIRETLLFSNIHNNVEIATVADIPGEGSGLGSSSALIVGLLNMFYVSDPLWIAEKAYYIERDMARKPVGKQDHYAASVGGLNTFKFTKNGCGYESLSSFRDFEEHMLLLWTGMTRPSSDILTHQARNFKTGNTIKEGETLVGLADECSKAFLDKDLETIAEILKEGWEIKKHLSKWITNEWIDETMKKAILNGAMGGKLCGAGGSGFIFLLAPPDAHQKIVDRTGLMKMDFQMTEKGSEVVYVG